MKYLHDSPARPFFRPALLAAFFLCSLVGVHAQADTTYRGVGRDPFARPKPRPPVKVTTPITKTPPGQIAPPAIQKRIDDYRIEKARNIENNLPVQKVTSVLLIGEVDVTGIVRTPRGYAAIVTPKALNAGSYTIYPGENFYDGQLVAIEEGRLVFRKDIRWNNNKVTTVVEMKQLRQPTKVTDPLATAQAGGTSK